MSLLVLLVCVISVFGSEDVKDLEVRSGGFPQCTVTQLTDWNLERRGECSVTCGFGVSVLKLRDPTNKLEMCIVHCRLAICIDVKCPAPPPEDPELAIQGCTFVSHTMCDPDVGIGTFEDTYTCGTVVPITLKCQYLCCCGSIPGIKNFNIIMFPTCGMLKQITPARVCPAIV